MNAIKHVALRKVISAQEMSRIEQQAYEAGASDLAFMQKAGSGVAAIVHRAIAERDLEWNVLLLCGKGNNAGDAYVAGTELCRRGFRVKALQLHPIESCSQLCAENYRLFQKAGGEVVDVQTAEQLAFFPDGMIVDGIFGTGFRGEVTGLYAEAIRRAHASGLPIWAIDVPSGVNGDTGEAASEAIRATATIYLQLPKTGFFFGAGWDSLGLLQGADFGLSDALIDAAKPDLWMMTESAASQLLPPIKRRRHKYQAGYVVGLAGSSLMPGAALLSGTAALRGGAGIVRMLYPATMDRPFFRPELLASPWTTVEEALEFMNSATACFVGPGFGTSNEGRLLLEGVLRGLQVPCVIDADGLNLLSQSSGWILPRSTVLTPHVGEMRRLLNLEKEEQPRGLDWISTCQLYACNRGVTLVVKGSPTFIFDSCGEEAPTVIPRGDPGMATAGSGDVLTGLLTALLSQGLQPLEAARLGTFLHALAGEAAAASKTSYSMVAGDITDHLCSAFAQLAPTNRQIAQDR